MFGKKSQRIKELENRGRDLEFLLCQGKHDYKVIDTIEHYYSAGCFIDLDRIITNKCSRCHRISEEVSHL